MQIRFLFLRKNKMIIYSKHNLNRKKEFQLLTTIERENSFLFSAKTSLRKESDIFLNSFFSKYENLLSANFSIIPVKPQRINDTKIKFEYKEDIFLEGLLLKSVIKGDREKFLKLSDNYLSFIKKNKIIEQPLSEEFKKIFGNYTKEKILCLHVGCIDLNLDNIIYDRKKNEYALIDYEWTFNFPIPYDYIIYRSFFYFYFKNRAYNPNRIISFDELLKFLGVQKKDYFGDFEYNFQKYVQGNNFTQSKDLYKKYIASIEKNNFSKINQGIYDVSLLIEQDKQKLKEALFQRENIINKLNREIRQKEEEIKKKVDSCKYEIAEALVPLYEKIKEKEKEIVLMRSSKFWILRNRYIKLQRFRSRHFVQLASKALETLSAGRYQKFWWAAGKYILHGWDYFKSRSRNEKPKKDYEIWIDKNEKWDRVEIKKEIGEFKYKPKISIITPVYSVDPKWLDKCIESVKNQFYENWELCLYNDASVKETTRACLRRWKGSDSRIKIKFGTKNQHISGASNEALKMATGEFVALLDNDDELAPIALFENVKLLNKHPEADFIYSDEDKIDEKGERVEPYFKPDWSPDLFLSQMYTCHLGVYRKTIIDEIGGFRKGYEGSQDYDLVLRFIEKTNREKIFHIPKILYHYRKKTNPITGNEKTEDHFSIKAKKALSEHLQRNKIEGTVLNGKFSKTYRIKRKIIGSPKISIVIPFRDKIEILEKCFESIFEKTKCRNFEIILVNNRSIEEKTLEFVSSISKREGIKIINYDKDFNFSAINNYAVSFCEGEYVLFLNNDTEIISPNWLDSMVEHIQRREIGAVGAKLLYSDNSIQHAGVIIGLGVADHAFNGFPSYKPGYFFQTDVIRNYSSVTAACMLTKKDLFLKMGGFNEKELPVAFNDVDYCLRLREDGYNIVYTPYALLYHHESMSRGDDNECDIKYKYPEKYNRIISERKYMEKKWKKYIVNDPFYSPNLTRGKKDFSIRI